MDNIVISRITSASPQYGQAWQLREDVLRQPIGLSLKNEDLGRDHIDTIFIAEHEKAVIACLMLKHNSDIQVQLRQMAVAREWQAKGVGRMLVVAAESFAKSAGYTVMMMHARAVAVGFYESLGYHITSDEFTEVGIPHFVMEKALK